MKLPFSRPQVHKPPEHLPRCCVQQTITVPVEINAKTSQKHDYPSKAHRNSFARRTGVERGYSTLKDPASTDTTRGWCRVMGLCAVTIFLPCAVVVRNIRITDAYYERDRRTRGGPRPAYPLGRENAGEEPSRTSLEVRPERDCRFEGQATLRTLRNQLGLHSKPDEANSPSAVHLARTPKCENESTSNVMTSWSGRRDSNPRPSPWQGDALPAEPRPRNALSVAS